MSIKCQDGVTETICCLAFIWVASHAGLDEKKKKYKLSFQSFSWKVFLERFWHVNVFSPAEKHDICLTRQSILTIFNGWKEKNCFYKLLFFSNSSFSQPGADIMSAGCKKGYCRTEFVFFYFFFPSGEKVNHSWLCTLKS